MIDFIKNNLAVFVSVTVIFISACFNVYQYMENKKLKRYSTEKELKKKKADLEKLHQDIIYTDFMAINHRNINNFNHEKKHLEADIEYLEKIKK